jgi:uncharacterized protein
MFNTVILKVVAPCNLNCTYCYEYNRGDETWRSKPKFISPETVAMVGARIYEYCIKRDIKQFNVNLHGGEPLMLGCDRIEELLTKLKESTPGITLKIGIQTNGTLFKPSILDLIGREKISVGVSIDGNARHNRLRVNHSGQPSFDKVRKGIFELKSATSQFAGLQAVIDLDSEPEEVILALSEYDPPALDLLPPFANHSNPGDVSEKKYSLGEWLSRGFQFWASNERLAKIRIRYFEDALQSLLIGESRSDWFSFNPPGYFIIASDGTYEGLDTLKVAGTAGRVLNSNVQTSSIEAIELHPYMLMRTKKFDGLSKACQACELARICGGSYFPTRFSEDNGFDNPSFYCPDMKIFFATLVNWCALHKAHVNLPLDTKV